MTTKTEELNALLAAEQFLVDLQDPKKTPRVPAAVRVQAGHILRHYPYPVILEERYDELSNQSD